jgi:hypothetical protein
MTIASLGITLLTFSLTMPGTAAILKKLKEAVLSSVQKAKQPISRTSRQGTSFITSVHPGSCPTEMPLAHVESEDDLPMMQPSEL